MIKNVACAIMLLYPAVGFGQVREWAMDNPEALEIEVAEGLKAIKYFKELQPLFPEKAAQLQVAIDNVSLALRPRFELLVRIRALKNGSKNFDRQ